MGRIGCSIDEDLHTKNLAKRLKSLRQEKGINQQKMAEKIGVSRAFISNIERGKNRVTVFILEEYCNALNMSPDEILQYNQTEKTGLSHEIIMAIEQASDEDKERIKVGLAYVAGLINLRKTVH